MIAPSANPPATFPTELKIVIDPRYGWLDYIGSRAMLEAEGVIPADMRWPETYDFHSWQNANFKFSLRRQRPEGMKGSRREFACCDWWKLEIYDVNQPDYDKRRVLLNLKNAVNRSREQNL